MIPYVQLFVVGRGILLRRKELETYIFLLVPTVISISFNLDDKVFTMMVKSTKKVDELIIRLMEQKKLKISLLDFEEEPAKKGVF
ncbi:hypothetical protein D7322_04775 [Sphingobacterium puteale]|uniref:Uncharacterized protein n=1 Tax=Sphingobacterium puteale TaxID=2420510 RepID=A0A420W2G9_9SPHI|nr:hypothetical protein [Sphingobacterium puteale]RKO72756.1 hypothetical protein D7322_04775 [Sphingobacterium puteale]